MTRVSYRAIFLLRVFSISESRSLSSDIYLNCRLRKSCWGGWRSGFWVMRAERVLSYSFGEVVF